MISSIENWCDSLAGYGLNPFGNERFIESFFTLENGFTWENFGKRWSLNHLWALSYLNDHPVTPDLLLYLLSWTNLCPEYTKVTQEYESNASLGSRSPTVEARNLQRQKISDFMIRYPLTNKYTKFPYVIDDLQKVMSTGVIFNDSGIYAYGGESYSCLHTTKYTVTRNNITVEITEIYSEIERGPHVNEMDI